MAMENGDVLPVRCLRDTFLDGLHQRRLAFAIHTRFNNNGSASVTSSTAQMGIYLLLPLSPVHCEDLNGERSCGDNDTLFPR